MALPFQKRKGQSIRQGLFLAVLSTFILLSLVATSAQRPDQRQRVRPISAPTPTPTVALVPPTVEFQALPVHESVGRGENLIISVFISNKSNLTLGSLKLDVSDPAFAIVKPPSFPAVVAPFGNDRKELTLKALDTADFAPHKLLVTLQYAWDTGGGKEAVSAQSATVTIQVRRQFEEEAKGFPGGTAAFLYLLLPIIPAILSYQFVEVLRKEKIAKVPEFKAEFVVAAFFAAVALNFVMLLAFKRDKGLNYSNPRIFLGVLGASLVVGALVPGIRLVVDAWRMKTWGFNNTDTMQSYLRKALLAPGTPRKFRWATGEASGEQWAGVLLKQPDGMTVLGMQLQVSPVGEPKSDERTERWTRLTQRVLNVDGTLINRPQLVKMVDDGELTLSALKYVIRGGQNTGEPVVVNDVSSFQQTDSEEQALILPSA